MQHQLSPVILTNIEEIAPATFLISWKRNVDFMPGLVIKIALDEHAQPRIYSICSGNHEPEMRVLFNVKADGGLTPRLSACIPGDQIWVSEPYGSFTDDGSPSVWIASGTGIAPFYSMFRSGLDKDKILIHGVRFLNQFYFEDELEWSLGKNYIRCCSREQSCDVFPGRVTDYLKQLDSLPKSHKYHLCGNASMVVEVRDFLIEKSIPYENIVADIYF